MNVTLTLVIYWSVAIALACGGLYALNRGFKLLVSSRGRTAEKNTIEIFGLKAKMGSIGSMVMVTAFLWGWAATYALPKYQDPDVTIALRQSLAEKTRIIGEMETTLGQTNTQFALAKKELNTTASQLATTRRELDEKASQLVAVREEFAHTVAVQKEELAQVEKQLEQLRRTFNERVKSPDADFRTENRILDESLINLRATRKRLER